MSGYKVYTTAHDLITTARHLIETGQVLPSDLGEERTKLYGRDLEAITESVNAEIARHTINGDHTRDVIVSILLDQSGSLRGEPQASFLATAYQLTIALTILGIPFEVLGHTTREWKGGQSRMDWLSNGKPTHPGRLDDLLHIIYKSFKDPWSGDTLAAFHHLYTSRTFRENIDGEAIEWAADRILQQPAQRRILIKLCDSGPIDDSTLAVNPSYILEAHLIEAVAIAEYRGVEVVALTTMPRQQALKYYRNTLASGPDPARSNYETLDPQECLSRVLRWIYG